MSIPPLVVKTAKQVWFCQWNLLMNGLAPSDQEGNYCRPASQKPQAIVPLTQEIFNRKSEELPRLLIGRSCPWAHRTWLVFKLRNLEDTLKLILVKANPNEGRWILNSSWLGCTSLQELYKTCGESTSQRATVPALIDPGISKINKPHLIGNESAQLVEALNNWPTSKPSINLAPKELEKEINEWQEIIQPFINNGVYKCGFARNQNAYNQASEELFSTLKKVENSLSLKGPWICGEKLTLADIRLFPTIVRWEAIYEPLFGCSKEPIWSFPNLCEWRKNFFELPEVAETCDADVWRNDYFGALFPLRPSSIIPNGPNLDKLIYRKNLNFND